MADAAKKAAAFINAQGGGLLGGRKVEVVIEDDESNPTAGVAATRKLLEVSRVSAIVGVWSSAVAMAIKPLTIEKGVPLFVTGWCWQSKNAARRSESQTHRTNQQSRQRRAAHGLVQQGRQSQCCRRQCHGGDGQEICRGGGLESGFHGTDSSRRRGRAMAGRTFEG